jgi:hypothetical protein
VLEAPVLDALALEPEVPEVDEAVALEPFDVAAELEFPVLLAVPAEHPARASARTSCTAIRPMAGWAPPPPAWLAPASAVSASGIWTLGSLASRAVWIDRKAPAIASRVRLASAAPSAGRRIRAACRPPTPGCSTRRATRPWRRARNTTAPSRWRDRDRPPGWSEHPRHHGDAEDHSPGDDRRPRADSVHPLRPVAPGVVLEASPGAAVFTTDEARISLSSARSRCSPWKAGRAPARGGSGAR